MAIPLPPSQVLTSHTPVQDLLSTDNWLGGPNCLQGNSCRKHHSFSNSVSAAMCSRHPTTGCVTIFIENLLLQQRASFRDRYPATGLHARISNEDEVQPTSWVAGITMISKLSGWVVTTPNSYSGGPGFNYWSGDLLTYLRFNSSVPRGESWDNTSFVVDKTVFSKSGKMADRTFWKYLKIDRI
jgi:hypothetical protein